MNSRGHVDTPRLEQDIIVSFECVIKQHKEAKGELGAPGVKVSKRIYSDVQLLIKHLQEGQCIGVQMISCRTRRKPMTSRPEGGSS